MDKITEEWVKESGGSKYDLKLMKLYGLFGLPLEHLFNPPVIKEYVDLGYTKTIYDQFKYLCDTYMFIQEGATAEYDRFGYIKKLYTEDFSLRYEYDIYHNRTHVRNNEELITKIIFDDSNPAIINNLVIGQTYRNQHRKNGFLMSCMDSEGSGEWHMYRMLRKHDAILILKKNVAKDKTYKPHAYLIKPQGVKLEQINKRLD